MSASFWPMLLGALVGAAAIAGIYEVLLFVVPWIYATIIIVLVFGLSLGGLAGWVVTSGKCRSKPVALGSALLIGLSGLLASYGWNYRRFLSAVLDANPDLRFSEIVTRALPIWFDGRIESGWMVNHEARTGLGFVGAMWTIEAVVVLAASFFMIWDALKRPFCERCTEWTTTQGYGLPGVRRSEVEALLQNGDLRTLVQLEASADGGGDQARMALTRSYCKHCSDTSFLTVSEVSFERGSKGELKEKREVLAENLVLAGDLSNHFAKRIEQRDAAAA